MRAVTLLSRKNVLKAVAGLLIAVIAADTLTVPLAEASFLSNIERPAALQRTSVTAQSVGSELSNNIRFALPSSAGRIIEISQGTGAVVYHIQDIHDSIEAQANLAQIVAALSDKAKAAGKALVVAVEGSSGKLNSDLVASYPNQEAKEKVGSALLKSGIMLGEEYAAMTHAPKTISLVGIENPDLYKQNVAARDSSKEARARVLTAISQTKKQLEKLESHNFKALLASIESKRAAVANGTLGFSEYVSYLNSIDSKTLAHHPRIQQLLTVMHLQSNIDKQKIEQETQLVLKEIIAGTKQQPDVDQLLAEAEQLKNGSLPSHIYYGHLLERTKLAVPALRAYQNYLAKLDVADNDAVVEDVDSAEEAIAQNLLKHPMSKELFASVRWIDRQEEFFSLSMVPSEWEKEKTVTVQEILNKNEAIKSFVAEQVADLGYTFQVADLSSSDVRDAVQGAKSFYELAEARSQSLVSNFKKVLKEYPSSKYEVALVAGGFHSSGILTGLKANGLRYAVIRPQLDTEFKFETTYKFPTRAELSALSKGRIQFLRPAGVLATPEGAQNVRAAEENPGSNPLTGGSGIGKAISIIGLLATVIGANAAESGQKAVTLTSHFNWAVLGLVALVAVAVLASVSAVEAQVAPSDLGKEHFDALRRVGVLYDLYYSDVLYMAAQLKQIMFPDNKKKPLKITVQALASKPQDGNFIPNSLLTPEEDKTIMGAISFKKDIATENEAKLKADAKEIDLIVNPLDAGVGENFTRDIYVLYQRAQHTGIFEPVKIGAKGTDLRARILVKDRGEFSVSVAEAKLIQLILKTGSIDGRTSEDQTFHSMTFQPLVNEESINSYKNLFDQIYFYDRVNKELQPSQRRTYRQVFAERHIALPEMHLQKGIPYVEDGTFALPTTSEVPSQVGGHAQLGFAFFLNAVKAARTRAASQIKKATTTIRVFYNGDNFASRPNEKIAAYMKAKGHVIYMLTTPATPIDVKGGKLGVRLNDVDGNLVPTADMMEWGEAKKDNPDLFVEVGQGRVGRTGEQMFNTNIQFINEDLLGDILMELSDVLNADKQAASVLEKDYELAKAFAPTRVPKSKDVKGKKYQLADGAIGSAVLNLNAYFLKSTNPKVKEILTQRGLDRIVHFVDVPRDQFFTPNKFPPDHLLYTQFGRFALDDTTWSLEDSHPELPLPSTEFKQNPNVEATLDWKKDAGVWADLQTLYGAFRNTTGVFLQDLVVHGNLMKIQNMDLVGRVHFNNRSKDTVDVRALLLKSTYRSEHVQVTDDELQMTVRLKDVSIDIDENGNLLHITPLKPESKPAVNHMSEFGLFLIGVLGVSSVVLLCDKYPLTAITLLIPTIGLFYAPVLEGVSAVGELKYHLNTPSLMPRLSAAVEGLGRTLGVTVSLDRILGGQSEGKNEVTLGNQFLAKGNWWTVPARIIATSFVFAHELVHAKLAYTKSRALNEIIAYPLGIVLSPLVLGALLLGMIGFSRGGRYDITGSSSTSSRTSTYVERNVPAAIMQSQMRQRNFTQQLNAIVTNPAHTKEGPAQNLIYVDLASLIDESQQPSTFASQAAAALATINVLHGQRNNEGVRSRIVVYNTDSNLVSLESEIQSGFKNDESLKYSFVGARRLDGWLEENRGDIGYVGDVVIDNKEMASYTAANTYVLTKRDMVFQNATAVQTFNLLHMSLTAFAYAHYKAPSGVLKELIALFEKEFKIENLQSLTSQLQAHILASVAA